MPHQKQCPHNWSTTMRLLVAMARILLLSNGSGSGWSTICASIRLKFFRTIALLHILSCKDFCPLVGLLQRERTKFPELWYGNLTPPVFCYSYHSSTRCSALVPIHCSGSRVLCCPSKSQASPLPLKKISGLFPWPAVWASYWKRSWILD